MIHDSPVTRLSHGPPHSKENVVTPLSALKDASCELTLSIAALKLYIPYTGLAVFSLRNSPLRIEASSKHDSAVIKTMLPHIAPAGLDGLSLCGSKASFLQGASSRPVSFLPSSKPHVVRLETSTGAKDYLSGRLTGRLALRHGGGDAQSDRASGSVWGVKVKRAKEAILQSKQPVLQQQTSRTAQRLVSARSAAGSTALAVDDVPAPSIQSIGAELEGWGEDSDNNLFHFSLEATQHMSSAAATQSIVGHGARSRERWNEMKASSSSTLKPRVFDDDAPSSLDEKEKENNQRLLWVRPSAGGKSQQPALPVMLHQRNQRRSDGGSKEICTQGGGVESTNRDVLLVPQPKPRLGARPAGNSNSEDKESKDASCTHTARCGTVPVLAGNASKGRLASTLPTMALQRVNSDNKAQMHSLLSVGVHAAAAARRARSADDPPFAGACGPGGDTDDGSDDLPGEAKEPKVPVDLAALQQKARERIMSKKKKEKLQVEEWEAQQEKTKRERLEVKEGMDAEAKQRRATVYALNYLMHQQEWGAWLQFEREQKERPSSSTRSRPSSTKSNKSASKHQLSIESVAKSSAVPCTT